MADFRDTMADLQNAYTSDAIPWVIGYSGGKDSTTLLQLVFYALSRLPKHKLQKEVHVLSNDTMVENPAIREHVDAQLAKIERAGKQKLFAHAPQLFSAVKVKPKLDDRFWVNLIGRGYPSPNHWFRWCTDRLKIRPTNDYVRETVTKHGKVIILLGTRTAESASRAATMKAHDTGERFRKHSLPNAFVYPPIAEWPNNEVWAYLLQAPNPWGSNNKELLKLYRSACDGGECPFVIETGTQSCGKSRFGCWVCTVVERDRAMANFVANGYEWMEGLLAFRNWLQSIRQQDQQHIPKAHASKNVKFGAFLLKTRKAILERLLKMQEELSIELIAQEELARVELMLARDCDGQPDDSVRRFELQLVNGKRLALFCDFDVLKTDRIRLGPFVLKGAKVRTCRRLSANFSQSTRLMYHTA